MIMVYHKERRVQVRRWCLTLVFDTRAEFVRAAFGRVEGEWFILWFLCCACTSAHIVPKSILHVSTECVVCTLWPCTPMLSSDKYAGDHPQCFRSDDDIAVECLVA